VAGRTEESNVSPGERYEVTYTLLSAGSDTSHSYRKSVCSRSSVRNVEDFEDSVLSRKLEERQELDLLRSRRTNDFVRIERWGVAGPKVFVPDRRSASAYGLAWHDPRILGGVAPLSVPWRLVEAPQVVRTVVTPLPVTRHLLQTAWEKIDPDIASLPDWVWTLFVLPQFGVWQEGENIRWTGTERMRHMQWPTPLPARDKTRIVRHLAPFYNIGRAQKTWAFFGAPIIPPWSIIARSQYRKRWNHTRVVWPCLGYTADAWPEHVYEASYDDLTHRIPADEAHMLKQLGQAQACLEAAQRLKGKPHPQG
jgi:hypothetical protein